jgi:hypothetical protein
MFFIQVQEEEAAGGTTRGVVLEWFLALAPYNRFELEISG